MSNAAAPIVSLVAAATLLGSPAAAGQRADDFRLLVRGADGVALPAVPPPATAPVSGTGFLVAEIAAEADVEFFQACGASVPATLAEIESILGACSTIFENGPGITLEITAVVINTAEPDPYSSSDATVLLQQFRNEWITNHPDIRRDLAHLFTGKNLIGSIVGTAFLGGVCDPLLAYSLATIKWTTDFQTKVAITCQELAHVFGATHCDGQADCGVMCSALGGCSGNVDAFGAASTVSILETAQAGGCLATPPPLPVLSALTPQVGPAFGTEAVTLTGEHLGDTTDVDFGGVSVPFVVVDPFTVTVEVPLAQALGPVPVTLTTFSGTSNELSFTFVVTSPPGLAAPAASSPGQPFEWTYGADPDDFYALLVQVDDPTTFPFGPWQLLAAPHLFEVGALNAAGTGSTTATAPSLGGVELRFQVWLFDETTLGFAGATNVVVTTGT